MSITLLRWKSGSAGDTILKMLLESNNIQSQNRYLNFENLKTNIDVDYVKNFKYDQVAKMSLMDFINVDKDRLFVQLDQLHLENKNQHWVLKTHCYFDYNYPVIDIEIDKEYLPFVVKASLTKNSRAAKLIPEYSVLASKISNSNLLYKFDCYNFAYDILKINNYSTKKIKIASILNGWNILLTEVNELGFNLDSSCKQYFETWLEANRQFMPSSEYKIKVKSCNYEIDDSIIDLAEKYCLLALSGQKFKIL